MNSPRTPAATDYAANHLIHPEAGIRYLWASVLLLAAVFFLTGCDFMSRNSTVDINVSFADASGVTTGTPVTFGGATIGQVDSVSSGDGASKLVLSLDPDKAGIVKSSATAMISLTSPVAIIIDNPSGAAESVADGATIQGISSPLDDMAKHAGAALSSVQKALQEAANSFQGFINSDEWRQTQRDVERSLNDLGRESSTIAESMRKDVQDMMRDLESESGDAIREAESQYRELQDELRKIGKESSKEVIDAMQELLDSLKQALDTASEHQTKV